MWKITVVGKYEFNEDVFCVFGAFHGIELKWLQNANVVNLLTWVNGKDSDAHSAR